MTLASIAANRQTEPTRLSKDVRGELDWIVMKALEKDRNRRYETASGFAADIERHLHDEPVQACPPSAAYRFRKFASRNKPALLTATLVAVALIFGTVASTWQAIRATRAEAKSIVQAQEARQREVETQAVLDFVENKIFAAARPAGEDGGLGHNVTLRQAVEAALPFVESSFADQPLNEARLRITLGTSFLQLGQPAVAADQFQKARALFTKHLGPNDPKTLESMGNLAKSYLDLGRYFDSLKLYRETLTLQKENLGRDHPDTLRTMAGLGSNYTRLGRHAESLKLAEETLALQKATLGPTHSDTLLSMNNLARTYRDLGRYDDSLRLSEETLALQRDTLGPNHSRTLGTMNNLALSYFEVGRYADAVELHEETLGLQRIELGLDHPDTLKSMGNLGSSYVYVGRHDEALKLQEETVALMKAKLGADHPGMIPTMMNLATRYHQSGRRAEALALREQTLALAIAKIDPDHLWTHLTMNNIAWDLATCTDPELRDPPRAVELANKPSSSHPKRASTGTPLV